MNKQLEKMRSYLESPEGQKSIEDYVTRLKERAAVRETRFKKILELNQEQFDALMQRMLEQHDDAYIDSCYKKGYEPHPRPMLSLLFMLAEQHGQDVSHEIENEIYFPFTMFRYMDYDFFTMHGQGVCQKVYFRDKQNSIHL